MTESDRRGGSNEIASRSWGNRILIASLSGILFLTLYPFEFSRHTTLAPGRPPFFLGIAGKGGGTLDVVLNILLFLPFGFGLAVHFREKGKSWRSALLYAWIVGGLLSYWIEFMQIYIPARDSGWEDVFSNSSGSLLGCLLFQIVGPGVLRVLGKVDRAFESWLPPRRIFYLLALWFVVWAAYSIQLQKQSHLQAWAPDNFLVLGNDASGRHPWNGKLFKLEMWDHALDSVASQKLTLGETPTSIGAPVIRFDLSSVPPQQSGTLSIALSSPARDPTRADNPFGGASFVSSSRPVSDLIDHFLRTNQFSVHAIFIPDNLSDTHGRIVSISALSGVSDLFVGQTDQDLLFWFRNRLSIRRPALAWNISRVLVAGHTSDVLFSFDGSSLRLFSDGKKLQDRYWGPGTALASLIRPVKQGELNGYRYIFYAVVFLPVGFLIAILARNLVWSAWRVRIAFIVAVLVMPLALECELALLDHRLFSLRNFCFAAGMVLGGLLWTNADRARQRQLGLSGGRS